jgi:predicted dehydrogenase
MKKIKAGIIGMGIGQKHFDAISNNSNSEVVAICELNKKKIKELRRKYPNIEITTNEKSLFNNKTINLISIASYDNYHYKQIINCINNNKNFIIEKPICLTSHELQKIKKKLKKKPNIKFTCNLVLRTNQKFINLKKKIKNEINKIHFIDGNYLWGRYKKLFEWRSKVSNYSLILGASIHMIDLVLWLLGDLPTHIMAFENKIATKNTAFKKNSFSLVLMRFKNGLIAKISADAVSPHPHFHVLKIFSKNKILSHDMFNSNQIIRKKDNFQLTKIKGEYPDKKSRGKLINEFINLLSKKKCSLKISQKYLFNLMEICFSAIESSKKNKYVKIKYTN